MHIPRKPSRLGFALLPLALASCSPHAGRGAASTRGGETPALCEANKARLVDLVKALPARSVASTTRMDLPLSSVGKTPGMGPVIEVAANEVVVDGAGFSSPSLTERVTKFREWLTPWVAAQRVPPAEGKARTASLLYFAAAASVDVQTLRAFLVHVPDGVELRLLVRVPQAAPAVSTDDVSREAQEAAVDILSMPDSPSLRARVTAAYQELSRCQAVTQAASTAASADARHRWPALQSALSAALPRCDCNGLDAASLRLVVSAEQRAGAASLGWIPLGYLRDERCGASMPLRSIDKLVRQLEQFDEEFSANFQSDAVTFQEVLQSERLRVFFCDALPGETVAALANAKATVYVPSQGTGGRSCDGWTFAPLSVGAPMGTVKRVQKGGTEVAFHYWQAAEEIRVFGPVDAQAPSKPTDERDFPCEETLHLTGIDERSIHLGDLQWFYDEATCLRAPEGTNGLSGCVALQAASSPKG